MTSTDLAMIAKLNDNLRSYERKYPEKIKKIKLSKELYEKYDDAFPEASCIYISKSISTIIPELTMILGCYDNHNHAWLYDVNEKVYIDLTLHQFDIKFRTSENIYIFTEDDIALLDYIPNHDKIFKDEVEDCLTLPFNESQTAHSMSNIILERLNSSNKL